MEHDFLGRVVSVANFREQRNIGKGSPIFPDEMFQTEIRVPFFQSHLWHHLYAFAVVFRKMKLICTNSKHDSGTKLTSPEFCVPFAQTVDRLVCPCKWQAIRARSTVCRTYGCRGVHHSLWYRDSTTHLLSLPYIGNAPVIPEGGPMVSNDWCVWYKLFTVGILAFLLELTFQGHPTRL